MSRTALGVALVLVTAAARAEPGLDDRAAIARPITLAHGTAELGLDLSDSRPTPIARVGLTDRLELAASDDLVPGALGIAAGYRVRDGRVEVALRAGSDLDVPVHAGVQVELKLGRRVQLVTAGDQLALARDGALVLALPVGLGVQVTGTVYLELDAAPPAVAAYRDDAHLVREAPVALAALISAAPELDLLATLGLDPLARDGVSWQAGVRFRYGP